MMPLTRDFRETVLEAAHQDAEYRRGLLTRGIGFLLSGKPEDVAVGKSLVRDYINATIGFKELAFQLDKKPQSLMRMFSVSGNPRLDSLTDVLAALQEHEGIHLTIEAAE